MRISVPEAIHADAMKLLRSRHEVRDWNDPDVMDLSWCEGLIVRTKTVDRGMMRGSALKVIGSHGAGVDNIDLEAAKELGIMVVNVPEGTANAVAELAFALMLAVSRQLVPGMDDIRAGRAVRTAPAQRGLELSGKTLGIVGFGRIGRRVAEIGRLGFGMVVHAHSRSLPVLAQQHVTVHATLDGLMKAADCIVVCTPLTPETRGLIGRREISLCRPSAMLVNVGRGGVVDETALAEALNEGRLYGAALDVFEQEPPRADNPLLACPRFVASQHIGINTDECLRRIGLGVAEDVLAVLDGLDPLHPCIR
ncbi:MAG: hydroxyacid dehydrogenase [Desulfovibrionaceae bacterium]|nr:hydroxyacid dehydrogenase [Desulfovibrionaceae bacterium]